MIEFQNQIFHLHAGGMSYIFGIEEGVPQMYYWGKTVEVSDLKGLMSQGGMGWSTQADTQLLEMPVYGTGDYRSPMLEIEFADGSGVTEFRYQSHRIYDGKPKLNGLPATYTEQEKEAQTLEIVLYDALKKTEAVLLYSVFENGALARSIRLKNNSSEPLKMKRILSASVDFYDDDFETLTLHGSWARERHVERGKLFHGKKSISSSRGASSHHKNPFLALVRPYTTEQQGEVYAMNLIYSGNFEAAAELSSYPLTRMQIGINPFGFAWELGAGQEFQAPEAILVYSDMGLNGMSRIYHDLYRNRLCRGKYRSAVRPVLVNNWEATYFDFTEEKLIALAKEGKEIGAELFVLDDGWFGKRNQDNCSLGDWKVNMEKIPHGLEDLAAKVTEMGLRFGLWFEPEMVNPDSDLYRAHPDWCIHTEGRPRTESRNQLVLDLSRPEVCDYIIDAVSAVLSSAKITYVKWDMNRSMTEIPRSDTAHKYMLGLYRVMETVTSRFPEVLFEGCSGGGGRFDGGMLYYMPQIWTSDDTDAYERLFIQYGTSMVYPVSAMGSHVSAVPNHQTGRITPLKSRGDVAMSGNLGYELDLSKCSPEEKEQMKAQIAFYKANRELVQFGDFYRIESPFEGNYAAWQFVSKDKQESILYAFKKMTVPNGKPKRVKMTGLDKDTYYETTYQNQRIKGDVLMNVGIILEETAQDFESFAIKMTAVPDVSAGKE